MPKEKEEPKKPLLGSKSTGVVSGGIGLAFFTALAALGSPIFVAIPIGAAVAGGWIYALKPPSEKKPKMAVNPQGKPIKLDPKVKDELAKAKASIAGLRELSFSTKGKTSEYLTLISNTSETVIDRLRTTTDFPFSKARRFSSFLERVLTILTGYQNMVSGVIPTEPKRLERMKDRILNESSGLLPITAMGFEEFNRRLFEGDVRDVELEIDALLATFESEQLLSN